MNTQSGRSMVEMLGVLAIIGVLSVGAIAGYSKAMMKYKLNKQSEQLTQILFSLEHYREMLGRDRNNIATNSSIITLLTKLNAIPLEMIRPNDPDQIYDIYESGVCISCNNHPVGYAVLKLKNPRMREADEDFFISNQSAV